MPSKITVEGFKSIRDRIDVEIRPLTLLAGANSSGKSSVLQAILLLKQTLDAPFDPGPLLLDGPHVKFTNVDQFLNFSGPGLRAQKVSIGLESADGDGFETTLDRKSATEELRVAKWRRRFSTRFEVELSIDMSDQQLQAAGESLLDKEIPQYSRITSDTVPLSTNSVRIVSDRFALRRVMNLGDTEIKDDPLFYLPRIRDLIHVPGLRGNPDRSYPVAASGPRFPGTFTQYTASIVARWAREHSPNLAQLERGLGSLGLTWKVETRRISDANIELHVGRVPCPGPDSSKDLVNIADVGLGVSHVLPLLVALLEAKPGQLVFVEQPEIHLHPKAQVAMASLLADAARRGVQLVVETHSSMMLLAIQTLVAEEQLDPELVKLHWFSLDDRFGTTVVNSADLDEAGRFGDWPEDFDDVALQAQSKYLDAVEAALAKE